jgi:hypothetical protein
LEIKVWCGNVEIGYDKTCKPGEDLVVEEGQGGQLIVEGTFMEPAASQDESTRNT